MTARPISVLSVVVPCHNEEQSLPELHRQVVAAVSPHVQGLEILLVNDGSTDGTQAVAEQLAASDPCVRAVALSRNFGKEAAMLAGLHAARGDAVVVMDADLQHPPSLLAEMIVAYGQGWDQVVARRTREGDPVVRTWLSRAYYRLVNGVTEVPLTDGVGDFRLMSRRAVNAVLSMSEVNRFSKGLFAWIGFPTTTVEYGNVQRTGGVSSWTLSSLLNYGVDGIISFNNRPLRMSVWLGLGSVLAGLVYVLWLFINYVRDGVELPGYLTIIAAIVFFGGVQLVFLGVIGEYVGRIYFETKRRPHFFVASDTAQMQAPQGSYLHTYAGPQAPFPAVPPSHETAPGQHPAASPPEQG